MARHRRASLPLPFRNLRSHTMAESKVSGTKVGSGDRGRPVADLLARVERKYPGIEEKIGLSSAALRAGQLVREIKKSRGWTQTQLADLLGCNQERISNITSAAKERAARPSTFSGARSRSHTLQFWSSPAGEAVAAEVGSSTGAKSQFGTTRVAAQGAVYAAAVC